MAYCLWTLFPAWSFSSSFNLNVNTSNRIIYSITKLLTLVKNSYNCSDPLLLLYGWTCISKKASLETEYFITKISQIFAEFPKVHQL